MYKHLINTVQNKYNLIIASYFTVNSNYTNLFCPFTSIYITICVTDGISQNVGVSRPETWQERFGGGAGWLQALSLWVNNLHYRGNKESTKK